MLDVIMNRIHIYFKKYQKFESVNDTWCVDKPSQTSDTSEQNLFNEKYHHQRSRVIAFHFVTIN